MKVWQKTLVIACILALFVPAFSGCSEEGPMEKTGKQLDKAADDAKDAAKKAFE
ncbi:MAG: transport-associated protein [Desulfovibrionaceae bacterium]|nr:transport-associated protein [Desulfovibrionaceae bacterium]